MATSNTYAVAGVSTHKGEVKIRFANDATRVKVLKKNGHTDIDLIDLPHEMTKAEIAQYLFESDFAKGRSAVLAAVQELAKKNRVKLKAAVNIETAVTADAVTQ